MSGHTALINQIRVTLEPFANISLARDTDPKAPDMIEGPDLAITPDDVRTARHLMNALNPASFALLLGKSAVSQPNSNSHADLVKALEDTERHLAFQHKWLSCQFDAMGRTRDEGTVGADTWEQIEATYALWTQVKRALATLTARKVG